MKNRLHLKILLRFFSIFGIGISLSTKRQLVHIEQIGLYILE